MDELYGVLNTLYEIDDNLKDLVYVVEKLENQGTEASAELVKEYIRRDYRSDYRSDL